VTGYVQDIKPMPTLRVASGFCCDCTGGSSVHDIVMLFMDLYIFTTLCLDVLVVVNLNSSNQLSGVDVPGDTIFWWEDVYQKIACAYHFYCHHKWQFLKGIVLHIHRHSSLRVRIRHSGTGTCYSLEHLFRVTPSSESAPRRGSHCPSTSTNRNPCFM
jgi:hypothetical protein